MNPFAQAQGWPPVGRPETVLAPECFAAIARARQLGGRTQDRSQCPGQHTPNDAECRTGIPRARSRLVSFLHPQIADEFPEKER